MERKAVKLRLVALFFVDLVLIALGALFGKLLLDGAGRSYNEQGRFFDYFQGVVYHKQSLSIYAVLMGITFVLFVLNGILMAKTAKKLQEKNPDIKM